MFSTLKQRFVLGIFIFIILSIPIGAYLVSQNQTIQSGAKEEKTKKPIVPVTPKPLASPTKKPLTSPSPSPSPSVSSIPTTYGPTLSLRTNIEGRSEENQATKLFVGIIEGTLTTNPKFLLSFTVDLPTSGEYSGLSLAGLDSGSSYTALLKGSSQIATSSAFVMSPSSTNLNNGQALNMRSGDLNDDNVINSADYSIAKKAIGATPQSSNWNTNADLNKDDVINTFDLAIITKNLGRTGASGAWTSPIPKTASPSASLDTPAVGSPSGGFLPDNSGGYWIWVPK